jgi:hypothetical protein
MSKYPVGTKWEFYNSPQIYYIIVDHPSEGKMTVRCADKAQRYVLDDNYFDHERWIRTEPDEHKRGRSIQGSTNPCDRECDALLQFFGTPAGEWNGWSNAN